MVLCPLYGALSFVKLGFVSGLEVRRKHTLQIVRDSPPNGRIKRRSGADVPVAKLMRWRLKWEDMVSKGNLDQTTLVRLLSRIGLYCEELST